MLSEKRMVQISHNIDGQGVYWTDNICDEIPVGYRFNDLPPITIMECFQKTNAKYPTMVALKTKRKGITLTWTKTQYYDAAMQFAKALMSLNIKEKSGINIIGFNSPEWMISWVGGVFGNYISAGVYSTNTAEVCKSIALNSDANVIIAENESYILRYENCYEELKHLIKCIVLWDGTVPQTCKFPVYTFNEFLGMGRHFIENPNDSLEKRMSKQHPGNICAIFFTSGTTGMPKGAMIRHDSLVYNVNYMYRGCIGTDKIPEQNVIILSFLPLSHTAAFICDLMCSIAFPATIVFPTGNILKGNALAIAFKEVKPHIIFGVPRFWEKIEEGIKAAVKKKGKVFNKLFKIAMNLGYEACLCESNKQLLPFGYSLANFTILKGIKKAIGFDRVYLAVVGASPIMKGTLKFFASLGIKIVPSYGLTETTGPHTVVNLIKYHPLTVGKCICNNEIKIIDVNEIGEGEVILKGRNSFCGYNKNKNETLKVIDSDGYIHTGDVGKFDSNGNLMITGRLKEIIKTQGGEIVAPLYLEEKFASVCKICLYIIIIGDLRKYITALIVLKADENGSLDTDALAILKSKGSKATTVEDAKKCSIVKDYITKCVHKCNSEGISDAQAIKKWAILNTYLSIAGGEITPTFKIKRKAIMKKYSAEVESLYL